MARVGVSVLGPARSRGLGSEQGWSGLDWSTQAAPGMSTGHASTVQVVADAFTLSLDALTGDVRGAGLTLGQELLIAGTVRRLACEADLIPAVLGTRSELLDVGRRKRLVPPAIRLAAWLRDGGCTYPGCTIPAQWCDAHHGIPWRHNGDASLRNTALLCGRHHTLVHDRDLICTITDTGVSWHL